MKQKIYNYVNVLIISIATGYYIWSNQEILTLFKDYGVGSILILMSEIILVHLLKMIRLYFTLYDSKIEFHEYFKIYCKVTPVSVILPFKLGEFFRMYCYGYKINNFLKGMIIIILDRFMDTIALVTVILLSLGVTGGHLTRFIYFLFIFLLLLIPIYVAFPGIYQFWRKWLLKSNASTKKLCSLRVLDTLKKVYLEVENVIKGRGIILYFLSLIAWGIEIGCLILLNEYIQIEGITQSISTYLTTAMNGGQSAGLRRFSFASIIMMILWYLGMKTYDVLKRKRKCK